MKIEMLQPGGEPLVADDLTGGDRLISDDLTIDLAVRVRDEKDAPVPHAIVKWMAHGHGHRFDMPRSPADHAGMARNKLVLKTATELAQGTVSVQTPDGHIYQVGAFFVIPGRDGGACKLLFHPAAARLVARPPTRIASVAAENATAADPTAAQTGGKRPSGTKATGNTLTIFYPNDGVKLLWGVPQYAWALYLDGRGKPLANQTLEPVGSGAVYIDPADPLPTTDSEGWAAIRLQTTPDLTEHPPFKPQDQTGNLYLKSQTTPDDKAQTTITFTTTLGGRGYLSATPPTAAVQGDWWPVKVTYRMPDGTPAQHRVLTWANLTTEIPVSVSTFGTNPPNPNDTRMPLSYTDTKGESTLYLLTNDGYQSALSLSLLIFADNILLGSGDSVQVSSIAVTPRPVPASVWPYMLTSPSGVLTPGKETSLNLYLRKPPPDLGGGPIVWRSIDDKVSLLYGETPESVTRNSITGTSDDSMYTATVYADPGLPAAAPERAYISRLYAVGNAQQMNRRAIAMSPPAGQKLTSNDWHTFTASYFQQGFGAGQAIRWYADPPDLIEFKQPYPCTLDASGSASIQLRAVGVTDRTLISIRAEAYNPYSGLYDTVSGTYVFDGAANPDGTIVFKSITPSLVRYAASTVTAAYTKGKTGVAGAVIQWTGQPDGSVVFSPDVSETDADGYATTSVTVYGPNDPGQVTLFASAYNDTTQGTVVGSQTTPVAAAQTAPDEDAARLDLQSLEGDTLWGHLWHIVQASYVYDNGKPVVGRRQVTWEASDGILLQEATTWTDDNGVATNLVHGPGTYHGDLVQGTVQASAVNPNTRDTDTGQCTLIMTAKNIEPASNVMTITVQGEEPIENGYACPISVKYTAPNGTDPVVGATITWSVFPYIEEDGQLTFGQGIQTLTHADGIARNTITYNGSDDLNHVTLIASAFNPATGRTDFARYLLSFHYVDPLTGVMINRPWATNPDSGNVNPTVPCQVITAKIKLAKAQGEDTIKLVTVPANPQPPNDLGLQIFDMENNLISAEADGSYKLQTSDSSVEFLVGTKYPSFFGLQAFYPQNAQEPLCGTRLWPTQLGRNYGSIKFPMSIEGLDQSVTPPVMRIPDKSTWPNPTFTVSLPPNDAKLNLRPEDDVIILLNYRVAFAGKVKDAQSPKAVDLAYCMLQPTGNIISYVVGSGRLLAQNGLCVFDASGTAQIGPSTGGVTPTLSAPSLAIRNVETIQSTDIVNGLGVRITPTSSPSMPTYQPGDEITVYCYLSGNYPLPAQATLKCPSVPAPVRNIFSLRYTVLPDDELALGQPKILGPLPQWCLAGYGSGGLTMNMRVVRPGQGSSQTFWSRSSMTLPLNTATV